MYAACLSLTLAPGDEVLTPAFDCDGALQPFRVFGLKLVFFRSDPFDFSADIEDIKKKITPKTRLIHIINHFGLPQPWKDLLYLRQETRIPILEDNAYSMFSKTNGRLFGTFGDLSIFSLRKNLPLIDGGLLRINNLEYSFRLEDKSIPLFRLSDTPNLLKIISDRMGFFKKLKPVRDLVRIFNPEIMPPTPLYSDPGKGYPPWPLRDSIGKDFSCDYLRPMSRYSRKRINNYSHQGYTRIVDNKCFYYKFLSERLSHVKNIKIIWPVLPDGIVPFCFSFLVLSEKRDAIFSALRKKYNVMAWPTLSKEILNQLDHFPEIRVLGKKLLQLNLDSKKVQSPAFSKYIENLVSDVCLLLT